MDLFRATAEEGAHIVAQLGAAYYGVVTEHHSLAVEDGAVGDELHLGDEVAARLVAGGERAGPCGGVFQHRALVGDAAPLGVTKGVAHAGVGDAAYTVGLRGVFLAHRLAAGLAHGLGVDAEVVARGEPVIDP